MRSTLTPHVSIQNDDGSNTRQEDSAKFDAEYHPTQIYWTPGKNRLRGLELAFCPSDETTRCSQSVH